MKSALEQNVCIHRNADNVFNVKFWYVSMFDEMAKSPWRSLSIRRLFRPSSSGGVPTRYTIAV
jgi:hypothetical protein